MIAAMRPVVAQRQGSPKVLDVADVPVPEPETVQVAIDVADAGVSFAEVMGRAGARPAVEVTA